MARLLVLNILNESADGIYETNIDTLDDYYKHLKCDCFDVVRRTVGDKCYDIFVDDCGLFVENPKVSAINVMTGEPMLVGNLIFANHDMAGNTVDLSDEDIDNIKSHLAMAHFTSGASNLVVICKY